MVVKNSQAVARATAPRLPPLPKLRVRKPDQANANPCIGLMSSVLGMCRRNGIYDRVHPLTWRVGCWASSGYSAQGCAALEQQLRTCMDAPVRLHPFHLLQVHIRLTNHCRNRNKTRRAPSITTFQDYTHRSSALTSGSRRQIVLVHCSSLYHTFYYRWSTLLHKLTSLNALRGVWHGRNR